MNIKDSLRTLRHGNEVSPHHQLFTIWGEFLDANHLLEEYPRPTLARDTYTTLNGYWQYEILASNHAGQIRSGNILVPFSPEAYLSQVGHILQPKEQLIYYKTLEMAEIPNHKRCLLHFQAVDHACDVYLNDQKLLSHEGGYLAFTIDLTDTLILGDNRLKVLVTDDSDLGIQSRGKQKLHHSGMYYTPQSGIWQTVWYEWVPDDYIKNLSISADSRTGNVHFNLSFNRPCEDCHAYDIEIYYQETLLSKTTHHHTNVEIGLDPHSLWLWTPEEPNLYSVKIVAKADTISSYFAFRTVESIYDETTGRNQLHLNGKAYFINGLLDQGYWPDGLMTAPSDEALIYDIEKAKSLGFNLLRKHIKIEAERFYYHCDRLGMLVCQDMVNGGGSQSPLLTAYLPTGLPFFQRLMSDHRHTLFGRQDIHDRNNWLIEMKDTINHLKSHPSIIMWTPFNEGWGQFNSSAIYETIKELDPTRLVDHASGWYDQKSGDFQSIHNYFRKLTLPKDHRIGMISEFGGYACYIPNHVYSKKIYGYKVFDTPRSLNQAYQDLYKKQVLPLKEKGLSGVVYTQLSDIEEEINGLLTYDRKICKVDPLPPNSTGL